MFQSKERRRERIRETLFPETWKQLLRDEVPLYNKLPVEDREELHGHIHVLLSEKHFEGAGGIEVTEGMKLIICAHAALLLLHRETVFEVIFGVRPCLLHESALYSRHGSSTSYPI